jgi:hypothetical protein
MSLQEVRAVLDASERVLQEEDRLQAKQEGPIFDWRGDVAELGAPFVYGSAMVCIIIWCVLYWAICRVLL